MTIKCGKCGLVLTEGQEVKATMRAYYHELPSKVTFSLSQPHDVEAGSLVHVECAEVE
jgi:hypothetical protein